jgi:hypothetical protein
MLEKIRKEEVKSEFCAKTNKTCTGCRLLQISEHDIAESDLELIYNLTKTHPLEGDDKVLLAIADHLHTPVEILAEMFDAGDQLIQNVAERTMQLQEQSF